MMYIVFAAIVLGVAALVGGVAMLVLGRRNLSPEERLGRMAKETQRSGTASRSGSVNLLALALDEEEASSGLSLESFVSRFFNLRAFIQQAGVAISPSSLLLMALGLTAAGAAMGTMLPFPVVSASGLALALGAAPLLWVHFKRKHRLGKFEKQLPEAMELLARSLRAGHSLADGISLIGEEMDEPIGPEFARVYEQQNLGISLEDALEELAERVPNMDLRFFVTAMIMQRQTGGDAAEILDKIGRLIRERFQLRGQVKALTGEGRLSGIVLLALPPLLGLYMYLRNPDYMSVLFTDPLGQKMLIGAVVAQVLGAITIKKIVDIKV